jgi:hypothetical protein
MKLDRDEKEILDSVERGEWRSARAPKRAKSRYSRRHLLALQAGDEWETLVHE